MPTKPGSVLIFMESEAFVQSLKAALETSGYRSMAVQTESAAIAEAKSHLPAVIIVDRQPTVLINFRHLKAFSAVPIVAVQRGSAPCQDEECLQGYEHGIDLIVCNQSVRELVARVRAILRRKEIRVEPNSHLHVGSLRMNLDRHEVTVDSKAVDLTPKEFQILKQFLESPGRVFSRQEMLNRVWGEGYALEEHALDVHVHSLRQKVEPNPSRPAFIMTVRGVGYKLRAS